MAGFHIDRISEDIKREIISLMRELKDPRIAGKLLSVVTVTVSSDLSYAKGYIRRALGNNLHLRKAPELTFIPDDSIEQGMKIFEKLNSNEN